MTSTRDHVRYTVTGCYIDFRLREFLEPRRHWADGWLVEREATVVDASEAEAVVMVTNGEDAVLECWFPPPLELKFTGGGPGIVNDTESAYIFGKTTPLYSVCMETNSSWDGVPVPEPVTFTCLNGN